MKCIILAAGYATRLYPLTKDKPKPLLEIGNKPILSHILDKVYKVDCIDEIFVVTNAKFYSTFLKWLQHYKSKKRIQIINDGTTSNESRLGAIKDIQYVIDYSGINDDLMILAGDNLFDFELSNFVLFFKKVNADCITTHEITDINELRRTGVIEIDSNGKVISFEEKPQNPKSTFAVPPFYIYKKETIPLVKKYLAEGNNHDAPGNFIPWLIKIKDVYSYKFSGHRYDIGTEESYNMVKKLFGG